MTERKAVATMLIIMAAGLRNSDRLSRSTSMPNSVHMETWSDEDGNGCLATVLLDDSVVVVVVVCEEGVSVGMAKNPASSNVSILCSCATCKIQSAGL